MTKTINHTADILEIVSFWENDKKMHKARRNQCKNWWNDEWRDRIAAVCHWLSDEKDFIELPLGINTVIHIANQPQSYILPIRLDEALLKREDEDSDLEEIYYEDESLESEVHDDAN